MLFSSFHSTRSMLARFRAAQKLEFEGEKEKYVVKKNGIALLFYSKSNDYSLIDCWFHVFVFLKKAPISLIVV
jgi:hypothetical protein